MKLTVKIFSLKIRRCKILEKFHVCLDPAGRNFVEFHRFLVAGEPPEATDTWAASSSSSAGELVLIGTKVKCEDDFE